jgi:hypothetical protein
MRAGCPVPFWLTFHPISCNCSSGSEPSKPSNGSAKNPMMILPAHFLPRLPPLPNKTGYVSHQYQELFSTENAPPHHHYPRLHFRNSLGNLGHPRRIHPRDSRGIRIMLAGEIKKFSTFIGTLIYYLNRGRSRLAYAHAMERQVGFR